LHINVSDREEKSFLILMPARLSEALFVTSKSEPKRVKMEQNVEIAAKKVEDEIASEILDEGPMLSN
jgi:hypothetical protein